MHKYMPMQKNPVATRHKKGSQNNSTMSAHLHKSNFSKSTNLVSDSQYQNCVRGRVISSSQLLLNSNRKNSNAGNIKDSTNRSKKDSLKTPDKANKKEKYQNQIFQHTMQTKKKEKRKLSSSQLKYVIQTPKRNQHNLETPPVSPQIFKHEQERAVKVKGYLQDSSSKMVELKKASDQFVMDQFKLSQQSLHAQYRAVQREANRQLQKHEAQLRDQQRLHQSQLKQKDTEIDGLRLQLREEKNVREKLQAKTKEQEALILCIKLRTSELEREKQELGRALQNQQKEGRNMQNIIRALRVEKSEMKHMAESVLSFVQKEIRQSATDST